MSRKLTLLVDETLRGRAERKLKTRFEWQAPIELQPCCLSFWGMMQTFDTVELVPLSPDSYVEIVFTPDMLKCKVGSLWRALQRVFVVGRLRQMLYLRAVNRCRFVSLRLRGCTAALVLRSFGITTSGLTEAAGVFPELEKIILGHLRSGNTAELRAQITAKLIQNGMFGTPWCLRCEPSCVAAFVIKSINNLPTVPFKVCPGGRLNGGFVSRLIPTGEVRSVSSVSNVLEI